MKKFTPPDYVVTGNEKSLIKIAGRWYGNPLGRTLPQDIGKHMFKRMSPSGYAYLQVENDEQFEARTSNAAPK
jgi:hypothetical protein